VLPRSHRSASLTQPRVDGARSQPEIGRVRSGVRQGQLIINQSPSRIRPPQNPDPATFGLPHERNPVTASRCRPEAGQRPPGAHPSSRRLREETIIGVRSIEARISCAQTGARLLRDNHDIGWSLHQAVPADPNRDRGASAARGFGPAQPSQQPAQGHRIGVPHGHRAATRQPLRLASGEVDGRHEPGDRAVPSAAVVVLKQCGRQQRQRAPGAFNYRHRTTSQSPAQATAIEITPTAVDLPARADGRRRPGRPVAAAAAIGRARR
jgi:hypothetical protein